MTTHNKTTIAKNGSTALQGDVTLSQGTNVTLTQSGQDISIASAGGSGAVATDTIYDAKGDLPVGTGADTAAKLTIGANDTVLTADSTQTTGAKWQAPWMPWNIQSLLGWPFDPELNTNTQTPTGATIYLTKIMVPLTQTFANVLVPVNTAGTNYTNAQTGLYSSAGVLLAASAVASSAGTVYNSNAVKTVAITVIGGQSLTVTGSPTAFVWAAFHAGTNNATSIKIDATGPPSSGVAHTAGLTASTARAGTITGHATSDLATQDHGLGANGNFTPSTITATAKATWFGLT